MAKNKQAAKKKTKFSSHDTVECAEMLWRVFPMLSVLATSGTERDMAKHKQLLLSAVG